MRKEKEKPFINDFSFLLRKMRDYLASFAEDEGFKPPIPERVIPDFESSAFDHSANLPKPCSRTPHVVDAECDCKSNTIFVNNKKLSKKTLNEVFQKEESYGS